jgi:hypothetical protein
MKLIYGADDIKQLIACDIYNKFSVNIPCDRINIESSDVDVTVDIAEYEKSTIGFRRMDNE